MKVTITSSRRDIPNTYHTYKDDGFYMYGRAATEQAFFVKDGDVEFDIRMKACNGFQLPLDCDIDMEIKFNIIPKIPSPIVKTFK